jgi:hypothetical protein
MNRVRHRWAETVKIRDGKGTAESEGISDNTAHVNLPHTAQLSFAFGVYVDVPDFGLDPACWSLEPCINILRCNFIRLL